MKKKYALFMALIVIFYQLLSTGVQAFHSEKPVTPYGDYCRKFSHYGRNRIIHDHIHEEQALKHYYHKKDSILSC